MRRFSLILLMTVLFLSPVSAGDYYVITEVLDGDTVIIDTGERVRLIGIDTLEMHPMIPADPYYAKEAFKFTKGLCINEKVRLEYDEANAETKNRDKYGRILAYIFLDDGTFVNAEIVRQGYGFCFARYPFKYEDAFKAYQAEARLNERGIWPRFLKDPKVKRFKARYEQYLKVKLE